MIVQLRKMRFRLLSSDGKGNRVGNHYQGNMCYKAGDVLESDRDLAKLFRNKFERVADETPLSEGTPVQTVMAGHTPPTVTPSDTVEVEGLTDPPTSTNTTSEVPVDEDVVTTNPKPKSLGEDVTEQYPNADIVGVRVLYNAKKNGYSVVSQEDGTVLKRYKQPASVKKYLADQIML